MSDGWILSTLQETCDMYQPETITSKEMVPNGPYPVYGANGVIGRYSRFNHEDPQLLLTCRGATCGSVNISQSRSWITGNSMVVRPKTPAIDLRFLEYLFRGGIDLAPAITGAAQPQITRANLNPLTIRYPSSVREQRRIVAILDEAFEGIATAKANAEMNLRNTRELFTNHLERILGQRGVDWHEAPLLSFVCAISTGPFGSLLHKSDYVSDGVPLVNPINIVDGLIVPDPDKLIDSTTKQRLQSYVLREGDIVVGRRGEIGRCAVVGPNEAGWVCGTGCFFVRPLPTVRSPFIAHLIRSREHRARLERASTGATMKNLSNTALGELLVGVPSLCVQDRALELIGQLSEECGRLVNVYEHKRVALDELKKSLLHQAFSGALIVQLADKLVEVAE